jgi:hypothetical protein
MLRASLGAVLFLGIVPVGLVLAEDAKKADDHSARHMQGTICKVDSQKNTVTLKTTDKNGKSEDKTFQLAKDVKILDAAGKDAKLASLKDGDNVCLTEKDDKITELKKHAQATITKVDAKAGTITVKMTDKDGKNVERVFRLVEDSEYVDSTGRVAVLDIFQSGDDILFVEADGTITAMKKAENARSTTAAKSSTEKK